ncbi:hypothetical protein, partial [Vibrio sp. V28_P6S34P95]
MNRVSVKVATIVFMFFVSIATIILVLDNSLTSQIAACSTIILFTLFYNYFVHKKLHLLCNNLTTALNALG